jgi:hypothetical protein
VVWLAGLDVLLIFSLLLPLCDRLANAVSLWQEARQLTWVSFVRSSWVDMLCSWFAVFDGRARRCKINSPLRNKAPTYIACDEGVEAAAALVAHESLTARLPKQ